MTLKKFIQTGDFILTFPKKGQWLGKIIGKLTFGKVTHAVLVYDKVTLFETDGDLGRAMFSKPEKYEARHLIVIHIKSMGSFLDGNAEKVQELCHKYVGAPYSYWDIATNAAFFWLAAPLRRKLIKFLGGKRHMLCSELVSRILYEVTGREELRDYEGLTPEDLRDIALEFPEEYGLLELNP